VYFCLIVRRIYLLFILLSGISFSQEVKDWGIEYRQKIGFLAAHRGTMSHLPQDHAIAGELSFHRVMNGNKIWHHLYKNPSVGATLFGGSVGNNEILGNYWGAYGFIEFPFVNTKFYQLMWKMGSGLGYTKKVYDQELNPNNVAMSSHVNALVSFGLKSNFHFGRNAITLGLDLTHFSNGAFKVPNLGINLPYLSLGYTRYFPHFERNKVKSTASTDEMIFTTLEMKAFLPRKKWFYGLTFAGSVKEIFPTEGKKYPVFGLTAFTRYFGTRKAGFEGGFDIISKQAILGYKPEIQKSQWDILQLGVFAGYLLPLDQFHFVFGMGAYLKDKYQPEDAVYHRVGMRYYFKNGINAQVQLKTHWARADYVEWGIGYTFNYIGK
jgi:hypothetical protein